MSISSTDASPSQSPSLSPITPRRVSSRRGSISASDPWGAHSAVNLNPSRTSSSRLTIVRVPPTGEQVEGRYHRRHGSNASISSTSSKGDSNRLSFAFTSFTPSSNSPGGRPASPSSPRLRPASPGGLGGPGLTRGPSVSLPSRDRISPEKLIDLARTSCNPRPSGTTTSFPTPVSFTPLPDDVYLPFIDRPGEVASLITSHPSARLFALLAQTFPPEARVPASANPSAGTPSVDSDPKDWTYAELENWLKKVPREEVNDATWVRKARQCILPGSELIWERIKGALGIPPELDTDEEPQPDPLEAYLPPPIPIPGRQTIVTGITSNMLDADVFEPDSPVVSSSAQYTVDTHGSPSTSELELNELSIEPVLAIPPPPPSAVDPTTGANMTSLHEVREEDEEEAPQDGTESVGSSTGTSGAEPVHGLRFSTSVSMSSPVLGPGSFGGSSLGAGSFGAGRGASPSPMRLSESEGAYDALNERGPGHPLFPSSFAHLSMKPTLRSSAPSSRSNSMSYPPMPAYALRRADSNGSAAARGRNSRPDWARGWDVSKHEDAVTTGTSSVSGLE